MSKGENPLYFGSWGSYSINDVSAILPQLFHPSANDDYARDPTVKQLLEEGGATNEQEKRHQAYSKAIKRITEQAYWLPMFTYINIVRLLASQLDFTPYSGRAAALLSGEVEVISFDGGAEQPSRRCSTHLLECHYMSRDAAIAARRTAISTSGAFKADLARRVAIPTESQNPDRARRSCSAISRPRWCRRCSARLHLPRC